MAHGKGARYMVVNIDVTDVFRRACEQTSMERWNTVASLYDEIDRHGAISCDEHSRDFAVLCIAKLIQGLGEAIGADYDEARWNFVHILFQPVGNSGTWRLNVYLHGVLILVQQVSVNIASVADGDLKQWVVDILDSLAVLAASDKVVELSTKVQDIYNQAHLKMIKEVQWLVKKELDI